MHVLVDFVIEANRIVCPSTQTGPEDATAVAIQSSTSDLYILFPNHSDLNLSLAESRFVHFPGHTSEWKEVKHKKAQQQIQSALVNVLQYVSCPN